MYRSQFAGTVSSGSTRKCLWLQANCCHQLQSVMLRAHLFSGERQHRLAHRLLDLPHTVCRTATSASPDLNQRTAHVTHHASNL